MTLQPFTAPYLLVVQIPYFVDGSGDIYMDRLWRLDFELHLKYLRSLYLAAPEKPLPEQMPPGLEKVLIPKDITLHRVPLKYSNSRLGMFVALPCLTITLYKAIKKVHVVHSGVIGWPFPIGWLVNPLAILMKKNLFIVIESLPWRASTKTGLFKKLEAEIFEYGAKISVNHAQLAVFNQKYFRDTLVKPDSKVKTYIYPTIWLSEKDMLSDASAAQMWDKKSVETGPLKIVFSGRLVESKGIFTLLEALKILDENEVEISCSIIGEGELLDACADMVSELKNISLTIKKPVAYGKEFFSFLQMHHLAILPCILDEQPRVLFDFYAQALPPIVSDIPGLLNYVEDRKTGILFKKQNAKELACKILELNSNRQLLRDMGLNGLKLVRSFSHVNMHEQRSKYLNEEFG